MPDARVPAADLHDQGRLAMADRHTHEADTYDAMAAELLAGPPQADFLMDPTTLPVANREQVDYLAATIEHIRPLAGKRILEVGVGPGLLAVWLAQQGATVVGLDISDGFLRLARERVRANGVGDQVTLVCAPIETFDPRAAGLDHDTYDAIIGNNVVHHLHREQALDSLARLMAPGAIAAFCEPVLFLPGWMRAVRNSRPVTRRFPPHTHTPDERALLSEDFALMQRRFRHVDWQPFQVLCRLQNFVPLSDPWWARLEAFDRRLLRRFPRARRLCRIAVITLALPYDQAPQVPLHVGSTEGSRP